MQSLILSNDLKEQSQKYISPSLSIKSPSHTRPTSTIYYIDEQLEFELIE